MGSVNISEHIGMVKRAAVDMKKKHRQLDYDDLVQEGSLGLMQAAERYDASKGKFTTYAYWWVLMRMNRFARADHLIYQPSYQYDRGVRPIRPVSLDAFVRVGEGSETRLDTLPGDDDPGENVERMERIEAVRRRLRKLPERTQEILMRRYGDDDCPLRQACPDVSRERVRQIEEAALARLRPKLRAVI